MSRDIFLTDDPELRDALALSFALGASWARSGYIDTKFLERVDAAVRAVDFPRPVRAVN